MARDPNPTTLHNPALIRGVVFCLLLLTLGPAGAEVFVSPNQLAQRIAAEAQRINQPAHSDEARAEGTWHAGVRPLVIVHVGHGRGGYDRGHLPGAVYVEGRDMYATRDGHDTLLPTAKDFAAWLRSHGLGPDMDLLLYGDAAGIFPARVYLGLTLLGLDEHTRLLDGHLREWVAQGRATTTDATQREPVVVQPPRYTSHRVLREGLALHLFNLYDQRQRDAERERTAQIIEPVARVPLTPVVLDARSPDAFAGDKRLPDTEQRGHVPLSVNLPWRDLVPDINRPTIVPDAEARILTAVRHGLEARQPHPQTRPLMLLREAEGHPFADDLRMQAKFLQSIIVTDDRGNGSAVLYAILRHHGWQAIWDERGLPGYVAQGGRLIVPPAPSTDAKP